MIDVIFVISSRRLRQLNDEYACHGDRDYDDYGHGDDRDGFLRCCDGDGDGPNGNPPTALQ
jgi:hypothetical protein